METNGVVGAKWRKEVKSNLKYRALGSGAKSWRDLRKAGVGKPGEILLRGKSMRAAVSHSRDEPMLNH